MGFGDFFLIGEKMRGEGSRERVRLETWKWGGNLEVIFMHKVRRKRGRGLTLSAFIYFLKCPFHSLEWAGTHFN